MTQECTETVSFAALNWRGVLSGKRRRTAEPWEFRERVPPEKLGKEQQEIAEMLLHLEESIYRPAESQELGRIALDWRRMVPEATKAAGILAEYLVPGGKWVRQMMEALSGSEKSGPPLEKTFSVIRREAQKHRLEQLTSMEQFEFTLQKVLRRVLGEDGRLVVFVDDLDRCLPETAIEILETIKLFPAAVAIEQHRNAVSVKKLRALNPVYDELVAQIRSRSRAASATRGR